MTDQNRQKITDPTRIRALAHPLRLELMDVLGREPEATATECAELTGESVASCSFHLRMLAKYGYVEPAERRGKEKPWRLVSRERTVTADWDDTASITAAREFAALVVGQEAARIQSWIARASDEQREWVDAATIVTSSFWVTAEELAEISAGLARLTERFKGRWDDPPARPSGARPARLFGVVTADPEREVAS